MQHAPPTRQKVEHHSVFLFPQAFTANRILPGVVLAAHTPPHQSLRASVCSTEGTPRDSGGGGGEQGGSRERRAVSPRAPALDKRCWSSPLRFWFCPGPSTTRPPGGRQKAGVPRTCIACRARRRLPTSGLLCRGGPASWPEAAAADSGAPRGVRVCPAAQRCSERRLNGHAEFLHSQHLLIPKARTYKQANNECLSPALIV